MQGDPLEDSELGVSPSIFQGFNQQQQIQNQQQNHHFLQQG